MNRPEDRWSDPELDRALARLVSDAVSDVEPPDRFDELRARTASPERRPWLLATGGAVLAAAAVVTAIALVGGDRLTTQEPGPAETPSGVVSPEQPDDSASPDPGETSTVAAYYVGETPSGPRLYREFRALPGTPLVAALAALAEAPEDPDYRSLWEPGQLLDLTEDGELLTVTIDPAAQQRPDGLSEEEARLALQQVVYTAQAAVQQRTPVRFLADGDPAPQVLGVPTPDPVSQGAALATLALVSLTAPAEGESVAARFPVEGVANSFEATVGWRLLAADEVVLEGFFTAEGWMGERLFPFSGEIDASSLPPGEYLLVVETGDASGGTEGSGPHTDTRTIVLN